MRRVLRWRPTRRWLFVPPLAIGIAVVAVLASSRRELNRIQVEEIATPVYVIRATRMAISPEAVGYGTVAPRRRWTAVAEVGGRVSEIADQLRSGIAVRDGQRLVQIERDDYELRLQQRQADVDQAKAQLRELRLNEAADKTSLQIQRDLLNVRQTELSRLRELRTRSAASDTELDTARASELQQRQKVQDLISSIETYETKINSSRASLAIAESKRREAERNLDRTTLTAPFDGVLAKVDLESGQYVAPGQSLFEVIDDARVEISAQFSVDQLQQLVMRSAAFARPESADGTRLDPSDAKTLNHPSLNHPSMASQFVGSEVELMPNIDARVTIQSGDLQRAYSGTPLRISSSIDETTRTLGVVVGVNNEELVDGNARSDFARLRVGMYCAITLRSAAPSSAYAVPRTAIDGDSIMIVGDDGRIRRRTVRIAFSSGDMVAILDDVEPGETIAVNPPEEILEGQLVQPIETETTLLKSDVISRFDGNMP